MQRFKELYYNVFNKKDNVTVCGREKCKQLILFCKTIDNKTDFGNIENGFMKIENIIALKNKLEKHNNSAI